jgi:orotidine-5'-phosphate decarboxylase
VEEFLYAVLDRVVGRVAVVKPQVAMFEQLGPAGFAALARIVARARALDLLVLMDAKRGDIGSTAEGYAASYLTPTAPFASDALTVNPYMGLDTLSPHLGAVRDHGRGLFVLVKTSNPGSAALQDVSTADGPLFEYLAKLLSPLCEAERGAATGWSSLGVVAGATYPGQATSLRQALPHALFLIPGYGAQGATAADAVASFVPGPSGLEGGLVNSSRAVLFPAAAAHTDHAQTWERAVDDALAQAIDELGNAVSGGT